MKIALDVSQTSRLRTGCAWHADALANAFDRILPEDDLLLYHQFGKWLTQHPEKGTTIEGRSSPFQGISKAEAASLWEAAESTLSPLPGNPDIVHSCSYMAPKVYPAKLVYTVHDLCFWTHPEYSTLENTLICQEQFLAALDRASALHFVSKSVEKDFRSLFPNWLESGRIPYATIRSGPRFIPAQAPIPQNRYQDAASPWLHVGTIEPRKNIDALLDAYVSYYHRSSVKRPLVLAGSTGWQSEAIHEKIKGLSRELPIQYLGYVDDRKLIELYQRSFAMLFSSHAEGFGLPLIEAMVFGLHCVAHPSPAALEFSEPFWRYSDYFDTESTATAMFALENLPQELYCKQCDKILQHGTQYRWDVTATHLQSFYQTLIPQKATLSC